MATGDYQSTQAAIEADPTPSTFIDHNLYRGKTRIINVDYTLTVAETASEVLDLCDLYVGDVVQVYSSGVYVPNPGTALTIDIGDDDSAGANDDRYVDGLALGAGGAFAWTAGGTEAAALAAPYKVQNKCLLQATFKTVTTVTAVKLNFTIVITNNS